MSNLFIKRTVLRCLTLVALLGSGFAFAQAEPTLNQIYEAAQAGRLDQAQTMVQQVLVTHPNSARAHFVQAELLARQGQMSRAREALGRAEQIAPGLPFAKPESVQALRTQLAARAGAPAGQSRATQSGGNAMAPAPVASAFPWGLGLALGGGAIALAIFFMRKKQASAAAAGSAAPYANQGGLQGGPNQGSLNQGAMMQAGANQGGLNGPQTFGAGAAGPGAPGYGQPGYGQPAGGGMGGRVMGGLATGLAVGAGVMAAQAIGKNLMGDNDKNPQQDKLAGEGSQPDQTVAGNNDLGGQNFGVNDAGSWDDVDTSASSGDGGGGDWDT